MSAILAPVLPKLAISTISRNDSDYTRHRSGDILTHSHSTDPTLHPFAQQREYTRALNAVKYEKLFAKPFLFALDGHRDAVYSLSRIRKSLIHMASGGADGEVRVWDLGQRRTVWAAKAHSGFVRTVCSDDTGEHIYTCSSDQTVKMWDVDQDKRQRDLSLNQPPTAATPPVTPTSTYLHPNAINCMAHSYTEPLFAAASSVLSLYNPTRPDPLHSFAWGADTINTVAFSPTEPNVLVSSSSDRCIVLYDVRQRTPLKKIVLLMQTNAVSLSPLDAYYFVTGGEDHCCYSFDMRSLDHALMIHKDHVSAVMSVDYAPTGREFVSGGYDRTVRLWDSHNVSTVGGGGGRSKEVYHTKRMQRVFATSYTADAQYVVSASDDTNLRVWKAVASGKLGVMSVRERSAREYREKLVERYGEVEEVRRIRRHRHVPKAILNAKKLKDEMEHSEKRKETERRKHKRPGSAGTEHVSVKKRTVRTEIE